MKIKNDKDIEGLLASCRLKEAPPGLRERVLLAARLADGAYLRWGRRLKLCLVFCPALLALIFVADAARARSEYNHIQALLDTHESTSTHPDDGTIGWEELAGDDLDLRLLVGWKAGVVRHEEIIRLRRDLTALLEEEFNDHEHSKSPN